MIYEMMLRYPRKAVLVILWLICGALVLLAGLDPVAVAQWRAISSIPAPLMLGGAWAMMLGFLVIGG